VKEPEVVGPLVVLIEEMVGFGFMLQQMPLTTVPPPVLKMVPPLVAEVVPAIVNPVIAAVVILGNAGNT
jgi:hypothetical protein